MKTMLSETSLLTLVDMFQLGDNMQTDIRVIVFEHLKKHRKKMGNGPAQVVRIM